MTPAKTNLRAAIVGATSLKGKELKSVLEERSFPLKKLELLDDHEAVGRLAHFDGEPALVASIEPDTFARNDVVFFASTTPAFTQAQWPTASAGRAALVDVSHALLEVPEFAVRVPFLQASLPAAPAAARARYAVPHPAAIILLALLAPLRAVGLRRMVATVFEPVSERGTAGIAELEEQTVRLLSFQEFPRAVFDAQVAFNLLPRHGVRSQQSLERTEELIRCGVARCAPALAERLAARVVQAPVFHVLAVSAWVECKKPFEPAAMEQVLEKKGAVVVERSEGPMMPVELAGRHEILLRPVRRDAGCSNAYWLWARADNVRLVARTAVEIAETILS